MSSQTVIITHDRHVKALDSLQGTIWHTVQVARRKAAVLSDLYARLSSRRHDMSHPAWLPSNWSDRLCLLSCDEHVSSKTSQNAIIFPLKIVALDHDVARLLPTCRQMRTLSLIKPINAVAYRAHIQGLPGPFALPAFDFLPCFHPLAHFLCQFNLPLGFRRCLLACYERMWPSGATPRAASSRFLLHGYTHS